MAEAMPVVKRISPTSIRISVERGDDTLGDKSSDYGMLVRAIDLACTMVHFRAIFSVHMNYHTASAFAHEPTDILHLIISHS